MQSIAALPSQSNKTLEGIGMTLKIQKGKRK